MATLHQGSLSLPFFQQHLLTLCLCNVLVILYLKSFNYYYTWYGDLWSVIFDVTIVNVLYHHIPCPFKMVNLINKCVFWLLHWPAVPDPLHAHLLSPPYSMRQNNTEVRPINNHTMASKCSSERKSHRSQFKSKGIDDST